MESRIHLITLGVHDLSIAVRFYRDGLGFPYSSASQDQEVAFFRLGGVVLALYPWHKLAEDATVPAAGTGFRGITLAHNVRQREDVSKVLTLAVTAGGTLVKPAQDVFWGGHCGFFADPDGHLWEVAWNPHFPFAADGSLELP